MDGDKSADDSKSRPLGLANDLVSGSEGVGAIEASWNSLSCCEMSHDLRYHIFQHDAFCFWIYKVDDDNADCTEESVHEIQSPFDQVLQNWCDFAY
jgi:hypothetical protein